MAQTVNTIYVDDLDDSELGPDHATTVTWSWRGIHYEFDTSAPRLAGLEDGEDASPHPSATATWPPRNAPDEGRPNARLRTRPSIFAGSTLR